MFLASSKAGIAEAPLVLLMNMPRHDPPRYQRFMCLIRRLQKCCRTRPSVPGMLMKPEELRQVQSRSCYQKLSSWCEFSPQYPVTSLLV